jgi:hypothetical protein
MIYRTRARRTLSAFRAIYAFIAAIAATTISSSAPVQAQVDGGSTGPSSITLDSGRMNGSGFEQISTVLKEHRYQGATIQIRGQQIRIEAEQNDAVSIADILVRRGVLPRELAFPDSPALSHPQDWIGRRSWYQQVAPGTDAAPILQDRFNRELGQCRDEACRNLVRARHPGIEQIIARLASQPVECAEAARQFALLYRGISESGATVAAVQELGIAGSQVDVACMAAPWDPSERRESDVSAGPPPGALEATGLLEIEGQEAPLCGALFLSATELVTARHCFADRDFYVALRDGHVRVRQASDARLSWRVSAVEMPADSLIGSEDIRFADDYIRLRVAGGPPNVPRVDLRAPAGLSPAFVAGYFQFRSRERVTGSPGEWLAKPEAERGLRWSRQGMCNVVDPAPGCFRMLCQTIPGFSGSPVFALVSAPGSTPLVAYGLVSGTEGEGHPMCGDDDLELATVGTTPRL